MTTVARREIGISCEPPDGPCCFVEPSDDFSPTPMKKTLTGLVAAPHTPFHADGSLAPEVIPAQARLLAQNGVSRALLCGTTGAGASPTSQERDQILPAR